MVNPIFQNDGKGVYLLPNVTAEELAAWEAENNKKWENGQIVDVPLTLAEAKAAKELEIRGKGSELMLQIVSPYSGEEIDTWPTQLVEAKGYAADPTYPTPMLSALVAKRGNTVDNQVARILSNETSFKLVIGDILGTQQAKIAQIYAATTIAEVNAITW